jgi:prepilin-type N-terminal cleavage/methylation domain-containing protein
MNKYNSHRGFTLLEVMISLVILGGLLITLIYTLNYHLGVTERQFAITNITNLAKEKIREMEKNPQGGDGQFPKPDDAVQYNTEIKDSLFSGMREIIVTVSDGKESVVLSELIRK